MMQIIEQFGASPIAYQTINLNRRIIQEEYQKLQKESWDSIITSLQDEKDSAKFFSGIKRYMGTNKRNISRICDNHGKYLYTPKEQEPIFKQHWKNIFQNNPDDLDWYDANDHCLVEEYVEKRHARLNPLETSDLNSLTDDFPPITIEDLEFLIKRLKHKAPGPTGISSHHMKHLPPNMLDNLINIFNHSMALGIFPECYKTANMIFIPKVKAGAQGTTVEVANHRPISLTEVPGKVFDRFLTARFNQHVEDKNLYHKDQHGFRPGRGCHTALATFHETITRALHQNRSIGILSRDVSKAFDKVWHDGLKYKLLRKGKLHPQLLRCLVSYFTDRKARISIAGYLGESFELKAGVPQGGCLSPSLYSFFTHDLPKTKKHPHCDITTIIYADDVTQIISDPYPNGDWLMDVTDKTATPINKYEEQWCIKTNTDKFKFVTNKRNHNLEIDYYPIEKSKSAKCLGLTFNQAFSYAEHTNNLKTQCARKLMKLRRFKGLSLRRKRHLYLAFIRPALIYPVVPLHSCIDSDLSKLQVVQNKALNFITNRDPTNYHITAEELHKQAKLQPLNVVMHKQAKKTWETIKEGMPDLYKKLARPFPHNPKKKLQSSRLLAEAEAPEPRYTYFNRTRQLPN